MNREDIKYRPLKVQADARKSSPTRLDKVLKTKVQPVRSSINGQNTKTNTLYHRILDKKTPGYKPQVAQTTQVDIASIEPEEVYYSHVSIDKEPFE